MLELSPRQDLFLGSRSLLKLRELLCASLGPLPLMEDDVEGSFECQVGAGVHLEFIEPDACLLLRRCVRCLFELSFVFPPRKRPETKFSCKESLRGPSEGEGCAAGGCQVPDSTPEVHRLSAQKLDRNPQAINP